MGGKNEETKAKFDHGFKINGNSGNRLLSIFKQAYQLFENLYKI